MSNFSEGRFITLIIALFASFILVGAWSRFFDNFAFRTMGLSTTSTSDTLIWALSLTLLFLVFVWILDRLELFVTNLERRVERDV
jgi:hypothetical protein